MQKYLIIAALIVLALGGWYWYQNQTRIVEVDARDTIRSWDFQASHKDGGDNEKRVRDEIARLEDGLKDDAVEPTDYILYVSLANQYTLLGDGKTAYSNLLKALDIDAEKTGLAWHNMATLMERLGAINTARIAYARAVDAQPQIDMYHTAYLSFLVKYFSEDKTLVESVFEKSREEFGDATPTIPVMAAWLEEQGRKTEADELRATMQGAPAGTQGSIIAE